MQLISTSVVRLLEAACGGDGGGSEKQNQGSSKWGTESMSHLKKYLEIISVRVAEGGTHKRGKELYIY